MKTVKTADEIVVDLVNADFARVFLDAVDRRHAFLQKKARDGLGVFPFMKVVALFAVELEDFEGLSTARTPMPYVPESAFKKTNGFSWMPCSLYLLPISVNNFPRRRPAVCGRHRC